MSSKVDMVTTVRERQLTDRLLAIVAERNDYAEVRLTPVPSVLLVTYFHCLQSCYVPAVSLMLPVTCLNTVLLMLPISFLCTNCLYKLSVT